jgi:hypothetical protein
MTDEKNLGEAGAVADVAGKLTEAQRDELLHYEAGEGFIPPRNARRSARLWIGIFPGRRPDPVFLLKRAHGCCLYALLPLGEQVVAHLSERGATAGVVGAAADHTITAKGAQP